MAMGQILSFPVLFMSGPTESDAAVESPSEARVSALHPRGDEPGVEIALSRTLSYPGWASFALEVLVTENHLFGF
jgi:hypothetical protein